MHTAGHIYQKMADNLNDIYHNACIFCLLNNGELMNLMLSKTQTQ